MPATGFWLADAEARHNAAPRSFFIPPLEHRRRLAVGRYAKLLFACALRTVNGQEHDGERMWVEVVAVGRDGRYTGRLANDPIVVTELACDDPVEFGPEHVIAIDYSPEELGYHPAEWAHIDARILWDDRAPEIVVRAQPPGLPAPMWFASLGDGPPAHRDTATLGGLTDRWPLLAAVFAAGTGAWGRDRSGEYHRR